MLDFAYHVHTDIGNQMIGAKINGKYVTANHQLANSEIVDILTYAGPLTRNVVARHQVRRSYVYFLLSYPATSLSMLWGMAYVLHSKGLTDMWQTVHVVIIIIHASCAIIFKLGM